MTFVEISGLKTLDVFLTAGSAPSSTIVRLGTTLARARLAHFSHAALVIAPSIVVESLSDRGIVISNVSAAAATDLAHRALLRQDELAPFHIRVDNRRLRIFAKVEGAKDAAVYRHVNGEVIADRFPIVRDHLISKLAPFYLQQYPAAGQLLNVAEFLPEKFRDRAVKLSESLQNKVAPGPFCSELVYLLFLAMDSLFPVPAKAAGAVAPSGFVDMEQFCWRPELVVHELPGKELPDELATQIARPLTFGALDSQVTLSRIVEISDRVEDLTRKGVFPEQPIDFQALHREKIRIDELEHVSSYLLGVSDPFWDWLKKANECAETCPERRAISYRQDLDKFPEAPADKEWLLPSYKRQRQRKAWDGTACAHALQCQMQPWQSFQMQFDAYRKMVHDAALARLDIGVNER